jgi:predicted TIM-barrel enzyme
MVGSFLKRDGRRSNPLERGRVERLVEAVRALRARA